MKNQLRVLRQQMITMMVYLEAVKRFPDLSRKDKRDLLEVIANKVTPEKKGGEQHGKI